MASTKFSPGDFVIVYSFGRWSGRVSAVPNPVPGWINVELSDGRDWSGTADDVELATLGQVSEWLAYWSGRPAPLPTEGTI